MNPTEGKEKGYVDIFNTSVSRNLGKEAKEPTNEKLKNQSKPAKKRSVRVTFEYY